MNGRKFFWKYSMQINAVADIIAKLPISFRKYKLNAIRNKNGSLAMLRRYLLVKSLAKKCGANVAIFPGVYFENIQD